MEFPELGKQCALVDCKQLDFLPIDCDLCSKVFCKDHVGYEQHSCTEVYKKDKRVPVCPLCNQPISVKQGEAPDHRVNEHIENDCKSDLASAKRKTYTNKCTVKGCKKRELVPVTCAICRKNFCLRHRHENNHDCINLASTSSKGSERSAPTSAAGQAAAARFESFNNTRRKLPQQTSMSVIGKDLLREREQRRQNTGQPATNRNQRSIDTSHQGGMTEDEALAFALQASLADAPGSNIDVVPNSSDGTDEDLALARAIAQSELDERNRQRRGSRAHSKKDSGCSVT